MSAPPRIARAAAWAAAISARIGIGGRQPPRGSLTDPRGQSGGQGLEYELEHLFSYYITVTAPEAIGPTPDGLRFNFYITGGAMTGPKVVGKVRPVGGDWVSFRPDGIGIIDVRAVLDTRDGALIYTTVDGTSDFGEDGYQRMLSGERPPSPMRFRTRLQFRTAAPQYAWLNRPYCLGIAVGNFERFRVDYDVYAVR